MQHILFFGDSLTAGYGLANAKLESFPALIGARLEAAGLKYKITNAGISGDTTAGGLGRLDYWLAQPVDIFVLELGINDIRRGISPATISSNLQHIVDKVNQKYPQVKLVILGMEIPEPLGGPLAATFNNVYKQVATANKAAYLPFLLQGVAGQQHLNLWDRVHPNAAGYRLVAESVWTVLKEVLN